MYNISYNYSIKSEDEQAHKVFDESLNKEDRYKRFFGELPQFNHDQLAKMTQIDYDREMAFIVCQRFEGKTRTLGVSRVIMDPDNLHCYRSTRRPPRLRAWSYTNERCN